MSVSPDVQAILAEQQKKTAEAFKVLVVGALNAGKTSMINALAGREFLPTGSLPETGVITELIYGEQYRITLYSKEGSGLTEPIVLVDPADNVFKKYCSIDNQASMSGEMTSNLKYERVVVEYDIPLLKEGIMLIDTVGMNDTLSNDFERYLPKADVVIYLMDATRIYTAEDKEFLTRINDYGFRDLLIVYTHFSDIMREPQSVMDRFREAARQKAANHTDIGDMGIHFIDSLDGLDGKLNGDHDAVVRSGIDGLEKALRKLKNDHESEMKPMASHSIMAPSFGNVKEESERSTMGATLSRLKEIAGSGFLNAKQKKHLLHQLQAAEARFNDSKLNLAIIGEFSCGKSTFINALFQREILSTNMQPTTAVPTYITWNNRHIDSPYGQYEVTAYDGKGNACSLVKDKGREAFESLTGIQLPKEPERLIDAVTTDNRLAGVVSKVTIKAPLNNQYKGICLIDTPGVNPGTEGTAEHVRITQKVLRDAADAAIIMFPADQVYTASFGKFLEENASHLLKHSIFVITKCDIIQSEGELKDLCDFVSHHLSKIGVTALEVHCISASYALDAYLNGGEASNDERIWQKRFEATIETIFKELASRRSSIVHENVTAVADQITRLLTDTLSTKRAALDKNREELANFSPKKMKAECNKLLAECKAKMRAKKDVQESSVSDVIGSAIESKKKSAFSAIDIRSTREDVSIYLDRFNSHAMSTVNDAISSHIGGFKTSLSSILSDYKQKLDKCYKQYHLNISTTQVHTLQLGDAGEIDTDELKTSVSGFLTGSKLLENTGDVIEDIFDSDSLAEGVVKTAIGLIALPFAVVGTIFNAFRSLDSIKSNAKDKVRSALESNRDAACKNLNDSISKIYDGYLNAAQQMPEKIVEKFSAEFSQAQSLYNRQLQSTNHQITQLNSQLEQLRMIASKVSNT